MLKQHDYSWGRAFSAAFLGAFLGAIWSATIVTGVGVLLFFTYPDGLAWSFLTGAVLFLTVLWIKNITLRLPNNADDSEIKNLRIDKIINVCSFMAAYVLTWILLRSLVVAIVTSL